MTTTNLTPTTLARLEALRAWEGDDLHIYGELAGNILDGILTLEAAIERCALAANFESQWGLAHEVLSEVAFWQEFELETQAK